MCLKLSRYYELTGELSSGLHIMAALQDAQDGGQAVVVLHLHLVLAALINNISQRSCGGALHLLAVVVEELQELSDPPEVVHLKTSVDY